MLLNLVPWLRMTGAILPLPHVSVAYIGTPVPLPLLQSIYYLLTEFILLVHSVYKECESIPAIKPTKFLEYITTPLYSTTKINHLRFNGK